MHTRTPCMLVTLKAINESLADAIVPENDLMILPVWIFHSLDYHHIDIHMNRPLSDLLCIEEFLQK